MAELTMDEAKGKFASKGVANAGLALGIIGTALGALNGGGSILGGGSSAVTNAVDKDLFWLQNVGIQKSIGDTNVAIQKGDYETYITLGKDVNANAVAIAQIQASLPYMMQLAAERAERYAENKVNRVEKDLAVSNLVIQRQLDQKVNGVVGLPWSSIISGIPTMPSYTIDVVKASDSTSTTTTANP
jgi:hypothetical protein